MKDIKMKKTGKKLSEKKNYLGTNILQPRN